MTTSKKKIWQLHNAKSRFSEVVRKATDEGPQIITKYDKECVVVLSVKDFNRLISSKDSLINYFQSSPLKGLELDISRDMTVSRNIDL